MKIVLSVSIPKYGLEMKTKLLDMPITHPEIIGKWITEAVDILRGNISIAKKLRRKG